MGLYCHSEALPKNLKDRLGIQDSSLSFPLGMTRKKYMNAPCHPERNAVEPKDPTNEVL
jgi:hypothetical protein